jgi:hypothetical protein
VQPSHDGRQAVSLTPRCPLPRCLPFVQASA